MPKNWLKSFWSDHYKSILASVLTTGILTVLAWVFKWEGLVRIWNKLRDILTRQHTLSLYTLVFIFLAGVVVVLFLLWLKKKKDRDFLCHKIDEVDGLVWERSLMFPDKPQLLCPKCLAELPIRVETQDEFGCVSCGFQTKKDFPYRVLRKLAIIEFEKRERTGESKHANKRVKRIRKTTQ